MATEQGLKGPFHLDRLLDPHVLVFFYNRGCSRITLHTSSLVDQTALSRGLTTRPVAAEMIEEVAVVADEADDMSGVETVLNSSSITETVNCC